MTPLNSQTPKVYKNNSLNSASFGEFTHCDYQIFLHLITKIGGVDENGKYMQPEKLQREHRLTANEYANMFGIDTKNAYRQLKKSCDKLLNKTIKIEDENSGKITKISVCGKAEYIKNKGQITVYFTDYIMPYLAQVKKNFLVYNLKEVANFRSIYTTRLYEKIIKFKCTGWLEHSLEEIRTYMSVGSKHKQYGQFKLKLLLPSCAEINKNYPELNLKFEEKKEGRKVVALRFTFNKKSKPVGKTNQDNTAIVLTKEDTNQEVQKSSKEATEIKNHISELSGFLGTILCQKDLAVKEQTQEQLRQAQKKLAALTS
jgi:plasmid replication initiation protein